MNIRDMHIAVRQAIQQIAAGRTRKYQPEELDLALNQVFGDFVRSRLRPRPDGSGGFEVDESMTDDIRTLIVTNAPLSPWYEGDRYSCYLPADYRYLLSDWSYTVPLWGLPLPAMKSRTLFLSYIQQRYSTLQTGPYYRHLEIRLGDTLLSLPEDLPASSQYDGRIRREDVSTLTPYLADRGNWYWERCGDYYLPNCYIHLSEKETTGASYLVIDEDTDDHRINASWKFPQVRYAPAPAGGGELQPNRLTRTDKLAQMLRLPFFRSAARSPVSELAGGKLNIYSDNSFIVVGAGISYVRRTPPMSLSLGCNCPLPEPVHQQLCDLAAQHILHDINSPGASFKTEDMKQRDVR